MLERSRNGMNSADPAIAYGIRDEWDKPYLVELTYHILLQEKDLDAVIKTLRQAPVDSIP